MCHFTQKLWLRWCYRVKLGKKTNVSGIYLQQINKYVHLISVYLFPSPSLHFQELAKYLSRLTGCLVNTANIPGVIGEQVTLRINKYFRYITSNLSVVKSMLMVLLTVFNFWNLKTLFVDLKNFNTPRPLFFYCLFNKPAQRSAFSERKEIPKFFIPPLRFLPVG